MTSRALHSAAAACGLLLATTCLAQETLVVRLGLASPLSGAQAHYGKDNENGVRLAISDMMAKGVTIGGKKVSLELLVEDDAADPRQATAIAQKFCDMKVNGVIGHSNSGTTIPASGIYNACGIPHITPSATNPKLTQQGFNTTFRMLANDNALGAGVASLSAKELKLKRVALIDDRTSYGQGIAEVFRKMAGEVGLEIVDSQYTTDKAVDFSSILTSIKSKNVEAIFFGGMDPQAGPMLRQMQQLGMDKVKLLGGDGICTDKMNELSAKAATLDNVICAEGGSSLEKMPGGKAWKARYDAKYPGMFQLYSPYTYDATMAMVDAMVRAGSSDPKVYLPHLHKTQYQGVTARIAFDPKGELQSPSITFFRFAQGKKVPLH